MDVQKLTLEEAAKLALDFLEDESMYDWEYVSSQDFLLYLRTVTDALRAALTEPQPPR